MATKGQKELSPKWAILERSEFVLSDLETGEIVYSIHNYDCRFITILNEFLWYCFIGDLLSPKLLEIM